VQCSGSMGPPKMLFSGHLSMSLPDFPSPRCRPLLFKLRNKPFLISVCQYKAYSTGYLYRPIANGFLLSTTLIVITPPK
jgi:hypothetical protein